MNIKKILEDSGILPDPLKDQFFLTDREVIRKMVELADLGEKDVVLEIGAGVGNVTRELAKKAGKVIAFEIDRRFQSILSHLPDNVDVHFENAVDFIQLKGKFRKKKIYNKIVSNLPFSLCEPLLHNLTFLEYEKVILLIPKRFVYTIDKKPVFSSFFQAKKIMVVDKSKFYPKPQTDCVIIDLIKLPDPIKTENLSLFLRQYLYQHEKQKIRNALMEGIIHFVRLTQDKKMTKNAAREIIKRSGIEKELLESLPLGNPEIYEQVSSKLKEA